MQQRNVGVVNHSQYKGIKMLEVMVVFVLGSFTYNNLDFFHTAKNQMNDGYKCIKYILWKDASFVQKQKCY